MNGLLFFCSRDIHSIPFANTHIYDYCIYHRAINDTLSEAFTTLYNITLELSILFEVLQVF